MAAGAARCPHWAKWYWKGRL